MKKLLVALLFMPLFFSCSKEKENPIITKEIKDNWTFKEIGGKNSGTATVPGTIHTDLLANKLIEDPFYRVNEKKLQWIDKKDWEYSTVFEISSEEFQKTNVILSFEGLDTYASVFLNEKLILTANNMFRQWEVDVKDVAKEGENTLRIVFDSPVKRGLELLSKSPYSLPAVNDQSENGELGDKKISVFTRKAGYHYGWDWGPRFVTSGIWRPIFLISWNDVRIKDVFVYQPKVNKEVAELAVYMEFQSDNDFNGEITIYDENSGISFLKQSVELKKGVSSLTFPIIIKNPKLWWTKELGEQYIYNFGVELLNKEKMTVAIKEVSTGLRSIKLVRKKDKVGESFMFELNGIPVFMKGANYIPNDNFLPRVTERDYQKVIKDATDANINMLRVWGGGIYENDYFYKLCNEEGILIWQDFMFACSMYPGDEAFLENVKQEVKENIIRLRNNPCIALWCGNNEINTAWHHYGEGGWKWKELYTKAQREEIHNNYLNVFHKIIPEAVVAYTDGDDYWPSSPQATPEPQGHAGYETTSGDMHYWGVWHGQHPFEDFEKYKARFMSEYGFQSFPDLETVQKYAIPEDYNIESEVMAAHQRSGIGNIRIAEYMALDYNMPKDFEQFLYMSQVLQARGVKMAIEAHRRAMPYCMGTMYWQINDCWPVASWSSTDYYHKWKALHYIVKKAYRPVILTTHEEKGKLQIFGISDLLTETSGVLKLTVLDFKGNKVVEVSSNIKLNKQSSSKLLELDKEELIQKSDPNKIVLKVEFLEQEKVVADNLYYFVKPKYLELGTPNIKAEITTEGDMTFLNISSDKLVRDLYIKFKNQEATLSDNYFDVVPKQVYKIEIDGKGVEGVKDIEFRYLKK